VFVKKKELIKRYYLRASGEGFNSLYNSFRVGVFNLAPCAEVIQDCLTRARMVKMMRHGVEVVVEVVVGFSAPY